MNPGHLLGNFPTNGDASPHIQNNIPLSGYPKNIGSNNRMSHHSNSSNRGVSHGVASTPDVLTLPPIASKKNVYNVNHHNTKARSKRPASPDRVAFSNKVQPYTIVTPSPSAGLDVLHGNALGKLASPLNVRRLNDRKHQVYSSNVNQRYVRNVGGSLNKVNPLQMQSLDDNSRTDHTKYEMGEGGGNHGIEDVLISPRSYIEQHAHESTHTNDTKIEYPPSNKNNMSNITEHNDQRLQDGRIKAKTIQTKVAIANIGSSLGSLPLSNTMHINNSASSTNNNSNNNNSNTSTNHHMGPLPSKKLEQPKSANIISVGSNISLPNQHPLDDKRGLVLNNWRESLEQEKKKAFSKVQIGQVASKSPKHTTPHHVHSPILQNEHRKQIHSPESVLHTHVTSSTDSPVDSHAEEQTKMESSGMMSGEYTNPQSMSQQAERTNENSPQFGRQSFVSSVIHTLQLDMNVNIQQILEDNTDSGSPYDMTESIDSVIHILDDVNNTTQQNQNSNHQQFNSTDTQYQSSIIEITEEEKALYYNPEDLVVNMHTPCPGTDSILDEQTESNTINTSIGSSLNLEQTSVLSPTNSSTRTNSRSTTSHQQTNKHAALPAIKEGAILRTHSFTVIDDPAHTPVPNSIFYDGHLDAISDVEEGENSRFTSFQSESPFLLNRAQSVTRNNNMADHHISVDGPENAPISTPSLSQQTNLTSRAITPIDIVPLHSLPSTRLKLQDSTSNEEDSQHLYTPLLDSALVIDVDALEGVEEETVAKVALLVAPELTPLYSAPQTLAQVRHQLQAVLGNEVHHDTAGDEDEEEYHIQITAGSETDRDILPALYQNLDTNNMLIPPLTHILPSGAPITLNDDYMCLGCDAYDDAIAFASGVLSQVVQTIDSCQQNNGSFTLKPPTVTISTYLPQPEIVYSAVAHTQYMTALRVCEESQKEGLVVSSDLTYRMMANKRAKRLRNQLHDRLLGKIVGITPRGNAGYQTRKTVAHTLEGGAFLTARLGAAEPDNDVVGVLDFEDLVQLPMLQNIKDDPLRLVNQGKVQQLERLETLDIEAQERELTNSQIDLTSAQNVVYSVPKVDQRIHQRHALDFLEAEEDDYTIEGEITPSVKSTTTTINVPLLQLPSVTVPVAATPTHEAGTYLSPTQLLQQMQSMDDGKNFFDSLQEKEGYVFIAPGVAVQVPATVPGQGERKRRALFAQNLQDVIAAQNHASITLGTSVQQDQDRIAATHVNGMQKFLRNVVTSFGLANSVDPTIKSFVSISNAQSDIQLSLPSSGLREENNKRSVLFRSSSSDSRVQANEDREAPSPPMTLSAPSVAENPLNHPVARLCLKLGVHFPAVFASVLSSKVDTDANLSKRVQPFLRYFTDPISLKSLNQDPELVSVMSKIFSNAYSASHTQTDLSFVPSYLPSVLQAGAMHNPAVSRRGSFVDKGKRASIANVGNANVQSAPRRASVVSSRRSSFIENPEQRNTLLTSEKKDQSSFFKTVSTTPTPPGNPVNGYTTQDQSSASDGYAALSKMSVKGGCYVAQPGSMRNVNVSVTNQLSERLQRVTGVEGQTFLEEVDILFLKHCCDALVHKFGLDKMQTSTRLPDALQQDLLDAFNVLYSGSPVNPAIVPSFTKPHNNNIFQTTHTNATPVPSHSSYTPTSGYPNPSNGIYVAPVNVSMTYTARVTQAFVSIQRVSEFLSQNPSLDFIPPSSYSVPILKPVQLIPSVSPHRTQSTITKIFRLAQTLQHSAGKDISILALHELLAYASVGIARTYIRELYMSLTSRTLRRNATDMYAGAKAIVKDGIVIKHAHDPLVNKQPPQFMIGGSSPRDDIAMDALGEEFHAISTVHRYMLSRNLPVFVPPAVQIDYCGYRLLAQTETTSTHFADLLTPEDTRTLTLVYGSNDNGVTVNDKNPAFHQIMADVGRFFNLAGHTLQGSGTDTNSVTLHSAGDVQGYAIDEKSDTSGVMEQVGPNQYYAKQGPYLYILHSLARMFPTESPMVTKHLPMLAASVFVRRLRAELLISTKNQMHPVSSDAFTAWGKDNYDVHTARANKASKLLLAKANALAQWLDTKHNSSIPKSSFLAAFLLSKCAHLNPLIVLRHAITAATLSQPPALQKAVKKYFLHAFRNVFHYFGPRSMLTYSHTGRVPEAHNGNSRVPSAVCIDWGILDTLLCDYGDSSIEAAVGHFTGVTTSMYNQQVQSMLDYWAGVYAQEGLCLPSFVDAWSHPFLATINVTDVFHSWGVSLRHMEYVRKHSQSAAVRSKLLIEMLLQGSRAVWGDKVKDSIKDAHNTFKREFKKAVQQARVVGAPAPKPLTATNEAIRAELVLQEASMQASANFLNVLLLSFAPRPSPNYSSIVNIHGNSAQTEAVEAVAGERTKVSVASQTMVQNTTTLYTWFQHNLKTVPCDPSLRHILPVHLKFLKAGVASGNSTGLPEKLYAALTDRSVLRGTCMSTHQNALCSVKLRGALSQGRPTPSPDYSILRQTWKESVSFWSQTLPQKLQQLFGNISLGALGESLCVMLHPILDTMIRNLLAVTGIMLTDQKMQRIRVGVFAIQRHSRRVSLKARRKQLLRNLSVARTVADANDAVVICEGNIDNNSNGNNTVAILAHTTSTNVSAEGSVNRIILESWLRGVYGGTDIEEMEDNEASDKEDDDLLQNEEDNTCQCNLSPCICSFQPTLAPTTATTGSNSVPSSPMIAPTPSRKRTVTAQMHTSSDDKDDVALLSSAALLYCTTADMTVHRAVITRMSHIPALRASVTLTMAMYCNELLLKEMNDGSDGVCSTTALSAERCNGIDRSIPRLAIPQYTDAPINWLVDDHTRHEQRTITDEQFLHNLNVATSSILACLWQRKNARKEAVTNWTQRVLDAIFLLHNDLYNTSSTEYAPLQFTAYRALLTAQQALYNVSVKSYVPVLDAPMSIEYLAETQKQYADINIDLPAPLVHGMYQRYSWPTPPTPPIGYLRGLTVAFMDFINSRLSSLESGLSSYLSATFDSLRREKKDGNKSMPLSMSWQQVQNGMLFLRIPSQAEHAPLPLRLALSCPAVVDRVLLLVITLYVRKNIMNQYAQIKTDPLFTHTLLMSTNHVSMEFNAKFPACIYPSNSTTVSALSARTPTKLVRSRSASPNPYSDREATTSVLNSSNALQDCHCQGNQCNHITSASASILSTLHSIVLLPKLLIDWFGADVNFRDSLCYGRTALHVASRYGMSCLVRLLLHRGSLIDVPDFYGQTPIMHAGMASSPTTMRTLARAHANMNVVDRNNKSVLHHIIAAEARSTQMYQSSSYLGKDIADMVTNSHVTNLASKIPHTSFLPCPYLQSDYDAFSLHCTEFMKEVGNVLKTHSDSYIHLFAAHCMYPFEVLSRSQILEARAELHEKELYQLPTLSHMQLNTRGGHRRRSSKVNSPVTTLQKSLPDQVLAPHPAAFFAKKQECVGACISIAMDYGVSLHSKCGQGETPLFTAVRHGLWRTMLSLVSYYKSIDETTGEEPYGHDIDHTDIYGCTPLMAALTYPPCTDTGLIMPVERHILIEDSRLPDELPLKDETDKSVFIAPPSLRARRQSIADNMSKDMLQSMANMVQRDKSRRRSASRGRKKSDAGLQSTPSISKPQSLTSVIAVNSEVVSLTQLKPDTDTSSADVAMKTAPVQKAYLTASKPLPYQHHHQNGLIVSLLVALGADTRAIDAQGYMVHDYAQCIDTVSSKSTNIDCVYQEKQALQRQRMNRVLSEEEELDLVEAENRLEAVICQCQWCATGGELRSPTSAHSLTANQAVIRGLKWRRNRITRIDSILSLGMASVTQNRRDVPFLIVNKRTSDSNAVAAVAASGVAEEIPNHGKPVFKKKSRKDDFSMNNDTAANIVVASVRSPTKLKPNASTCNLQPTTKTKDVKTNDPSTVLSKHPPQLLKQPKVKISEIRKHIVEFLYASEDVFAAFHSSGSSKAPVSSVPSIVISKAEDLPAKMPVRKLRTLHSDAFL